MTKYKFSNYQGWRIINFILHNDKCIRELSSLNAIDCIELINKSRINQHVTFISIVLSKMLYSTFLRCSFFRSFQFMKGLGGSRSQIVGLSNNSCKPISNTAWVRFVDYKKGALDSQPQVIKFTSCLPMVGGSLRVLQLLPPLNWSP